MEKRDRIDNRVTNSPIVNSPGSIQAPGGTVNIGTQRRAITTEQLKAMAAILKAHGPETVHVLIHGQGEPRNYGVQIAGVLDAGGWHAQVINQSMIPVMYGVQCFSKDAGVRDAISSAFEKGHIECPCSDATYDHPHVIVVGPPL
jgi:hypothetical protein